MNCCTLAPPMPRHFADDDLPNPPECSPLDSAQARRAERMPVIISPDDRSASVA